MDCGDRESSGMTRIYIITILIIVSDIDHFKKCIDHDLNMPCKRKPSCILGSPTLCPHQFFTRTNLLETSPSLPPLKDVGQGWELSSTCRRRSKRRFHEATFAAINVALSLNLHP